MNHIQLRFQLVCLASCTVALFGCSKKDAPPEAIGDPSAQTAAAARPEGHGRARMNFDDIDKNKDGKVTADEAGEAWKFLSKADTNGDGAVTKDEFEAMHQHRNKDQEAK